MGTLALGAVFCSFVIEKFGRKSLLLVSQFIICICLIGISACFYYQLESYYSIIIIVTYITGFSFGSGPITWIYMADILPGIGISLASAVLWLLTVFVGLFFPWFTNKYSMGASFVFFFVCSLIGLIFIIFCVKETKGKD